MLERRIVLMDNEISLLISQTISSLPFLLAVMGSASLIALILCACEKFIDVFFSFVLGKNLKL